MRSTQKNQEMYVTFAIPDRVIPQLGYNPAMEPLPRTEVQFQFVLFVALYIVVPSY